MSATGKPSNSSVPSRYSRVRAWHRVGLIWQMEDAAISWRSEPAAFTRPDRHADRCPGIQSLDLRVGTRRPGRVRRGDAVRGVEEDLLERAGQVAAPH
jgi:hypothetical protein